VRIFPEAVEAAMKTQPDVALLDIEMPGTDGLNAARELHKSLPSCRTVILTTFGRSGYLRQAMESGAVGFLLILLPNCLFQRGLFVTTSPLASRN
jgi:two-component system response regulator DesR